MSDLIQWSKGKWWQSDFNPMIGCQKVSPACDNCWAFGWADRFHQPFTPHQSTKQKPKRKGVVFCGSLTDLFGDWTCVHEDGRYHWRANDWIGEAIGWNLTNPYRDKAVYIWLTKRVKNMAEALDEGGWDDYDSYCGDAMNVWEFKDADMSNHYFGFTSENQEWYDKRIAEAQAFPEWANIWISCEPLLGPIDFHFEDYAKKPKWIVIGCESGGKRRPCNQEWIADMVAKCCKEGIPVFVKQMDIGGVCEVDVTKFPCHLQIRQVPWAGKIVG